MQNFAFLIIPFSKRHTYFKNVVLKVVNVCKMKELLTCQNQKKTLKKVGNKKNAALCFMLDGYNKKTWRPCLGFHLGLNFSYHLANNFSDFVKRLLTF